MIYRKVYVLVLLLVSAGCDRQPKDESEESSSEKENQGITDRYYPDYDYSKAFYKNFYERFDKKEMEKILAIPASALDISPGLTEGDYITRINKSDAEERYTILLLREDNEPEIARLYKNIIKDNNTFEEGNLEQFMNQPHTLDVPGDVKAFWNNHWGTLTIFLHKKRVMLIRTLEPARLMKQSEDKKMELEKNAIQLAAYYLNQF